MARLLFKNGKSAIIDPETLEISMGDATIQKILSEYVSITKDDIASELAYFPDVNHEVARRIAERFNGSMEDWPERNYGDGIDGAITESAITESQAETKVKQPPLND